MSWSRFLSILSRIYFLLSFIESMACLNFWDTSEIILSQVWEMEILVDTTISVCKLFYSVCKFDLEISSLS